ncbi:hypothetical protein AURDEDRAFT_121913 [Auricularia subglabra TFB-10046 SS5]|nr:hypothetical protein AURDEDRAFT_121913 [Auricularia subglabra TFB-10046 SS5]
MRPLEYQAARRRSTRRTTTVKANIQSKNLAPGASLDAVKAKIQDKTSRSMQPLARHTTTHLAPGASLDDVKAKIQDMHLAPGASLDDVKAKIQDKIQDEGLHGARRDSVKAKIQHRATAASNPTAPCRHCTGTASSKRAAAMQSRQGLQLRAAGGFARRTPSRPDKPAARSTLTFKACSAREVKIQDPSRRHEVKAPS